MLRRILVAVGLGLAALSSPVVAAVEYPDPSEPDVMWQFGFWDTTTDTPVAWGWLAHDATLPGTVGLADLTHFHIEVQGVGYGLAEMRGLTDQAWLEWNVDGGGFVGNDSVCGIGGCIRALVSARSTDGSRGFLIDDATMRIVEYSQGRTQGYDMFGMGAALPSPQPVPEPASWALLIAGFGLVGAVQRQRHGAKGRIAA